MIHHFYESFLESSEHGGSEAFQLKSKKMSDKKNTFVNINAIVNDFFK